jgi:hypothetical protein
MYCSIQDAWGNNETVIPSNNSNNYQINKSNTDGMISNQNESFGSRLQRIPSYETPSLVSAVENFTDKDIEEFLVWKNKSDIPNEISKECLNIIGHFKNCDKCKSYYYKINGNIYDLNSLISKVGITLIDSSNKEIVVVFLIGMVLILIFHLFNK